MQGYPTNSTSYARSMLQALNDSATSLKAQRPGLQQLRDNSLDNLEYERLDLLDAIAERFEPSDRLGKDLYGGLLKHVAAKTPTSIDKIRLHNKLKAAA